MRPVPSPFSKSRLHSLCNAFSLPLFKAQTSLYRFFFPLQNQVVQIHKQTTLSIVKFGEQPISPFSFWVRGSDFGGNVEVVQILEETFQFTALNRWGSLGGLQVCSRKVGDKPLGVGRSPFFQLKWPSISPCFPASHSPTLYCLAL